MNAEAAVSVGICLWLGRPQVANVGLQCRQQSGRIIRNGRFRPVFIILIEFPEQQKGSDRMASQGFQKWVSAGNLHFLGIDFHRWKHLPMVQIPEKPKRRQQHIQTHPRAPFRQETQHLNEQRIERSGAQNQKLREFGCQTSPKIRIFAQAGHFECGVRDQNFPLKFPPQLTLPFFKRRQFLSLRFVGCPPADHLRTKVSVLIETVGEQAGQGKTIARSRRPHPEALRIICHVGEDFPQKLPF